MLRKKEKNMRKSNGFTLIEIAIVLIIIGLILAMIFKGKDLIEGSKVKNLAAQNNKILGGMNIFYERYGFYPGDGCPADATTVAACNLAKDGRLLTAAEQDRFWYMLIDATGMLTRADRKNIFGQEWVLTSGGAAGYEWLSMPTGMVGDGRIVCQVDKMIDDGIYNSGIVLGSTAYTAVTDCWTLTAQSNISLRLLP